MGSILATLDAATRAAFETLGYPSEIGGTRESDRPDMAPFQCNGAMAAAGIAKKRGEKVNPRDIAAKAVDARNRRARFYQYSPEGGSAKRPGK